MNVSRTSYVEKLKERINKVRFGLELETCVHMIDNEAFVKKGEEKEDTLLSTSVTSVANEVSGKTFYDKFITSDIKKAL